MDDGAAKIACDIQGSSEAMELRILQLFAPSQQSPIVAPVLDDDERQSLWRADALHRARNLAQLAASLANVASNPSREWFGDGATREIESLSSLFARLAQDDGDPCEVDCSAMLADVVDGLAGIFGQARHIVCEVNVEPISLSQEKRRALVLIASELIINTLKYAFPSGQGGRISLVFGQDQGRVRLDVRDNGIGHVVHPGTGGGEGSTLIRRLGSILDAEFQTTDGLEAKGWGVVVSMPAVSS